MFENHPRILSLLLYISLIWGLEFAVHYVLLVLGFREPVGLLPPMATLNPKKGFFNSHALRILTCGYNTGFMLAFEGGRGNNMISLHLIFGFVQHSHLNSDSRKSMILRIPLGNGVLCVFAAGPKNSINTFKLFWNAQHMIGVSHLCNRLSQM